MPLTPKGKKVLAAEEKEYGGKKKGESVFYASINSGKLKGAEGSAKKSSSKVTDHISAIHKAMPKRSY